MAVTLQMMSNSRRSSPVINAPLPIDQEGRRYCSNRREFEIMAVIWQQLMYAQVGHVRSDVPHKN
jgi:hypothetical protein